MFDGTCIEQGCDYAQWGARCVRCGTFNGPLFAWNMQVAREAKRLGVSREEAQAQLSRAAQLAEDYESYKQAVFG